MPTITINGVKHTPGSNTLKKMKRKAAAEAAAKSSSSNKPKSKKPKAKASEKAPIPATRKKAPPKGLIKLMDPRTTPKGPQGRRNKSKAFTKGGNGGDKKSTVLGIGPKAKLSTDKKSWKNKGNQMVKVMKYE